MGHPAKRSGAGGTLSGDLDEVPGRSVSAPAARGTLSGDLDGEPIPGEATAKGTLSGEPETVALEEIPGEATAKGTLSGTLSGDGGGAPASRLEEPDHEPGAETLTERLSSFDFVIEREIGRGGMGVVWLAKQRSLGRPVALKTLKTELAAGPTAAKFAAEAIVTGRLEHPNIPPVHLYGHDPDGHPFLSMKLVKGVEWARLLEPKSEEERARAGKLDLRGHLEIIQRVCEAIAFAHSNGVIHRDLKPENVMVGAFGEVLVMDWGIALELSERKPPAPGAPRRPVGTPAYLPPEMAAADEARMGPWTDVYLLGGMLYELLTGAPPHQGESLLAVLLAAQQGDIEPPRKRAPGREIPQLLAEIAMCALEKKPEERFQSAEELSAAIGDYLRNEASLKLSAAAIAELARIEEAIAAAQRPGAAKVDFYPRLAACVAELAQAVRLWSGNREARDGAVRAHLAYASCAIDKGDLGLAASELEAVPADHPLALDLRARIGRMRAARKAADRRRRRILAGLGVALLVVAGLFLHQLVERAKRQRAVRLAAASSLLSPDDRVSIYWSALAIDDTWAEGEAELARAYIERANERYTSDPDAGTRDLRLAVTPFDRAIELKPDDAGTLYDRGDLQEMRGDMASALVDFHRTLALAPESQPGYSAAAEIALAERRFDDAEDAAEASLEQGASEGAYFLRALARFAKGDAAGALEDAEAFGKYRPTDEWTFALDALCLIANGREREAGDKLVIATRIHPRGPHVAPLLAYLAARDGDVPRALGLAAKAKRDREETAGCFLADEQWGAAAMAPAPLDAVGKALVLDVDWKVLAPAATPAAHAMRERGEQRLAHGEVELALADAERVLAEHPADGSARLLRSQCFIELGHLDAVGKDLDMIERLAPHRAADVAKARARLAERQAAAGAAEPAKEGE